MIEIHITQTELESKLYQIEKRAFNIRKRIEKKEQFDITEQVKELSEMFDNLNSCFKEME